MTRQTARSSLAQFRSVFAVYLVVNGIVTLIRVESKELKLLPSVLLQHFYTKRMPYGAFAVSR